MPVALAGPGTSDHAKRSTETRQHSGDETAAAPASAQKVQQAPTTCAICLEAQQAAAMHRFADCGHSFCRACLRTYALAAIAARSVPIP